MNESNTVSYSEPQSSRNSSDDNNSPLSSIEAFFKQESAGGILLIIATILALLLKNSHLIDQYEAFLHLPVEVRLAALHIDKPLILWINDEYERLAKGSRHDTAH